MIMPSSRLIQTSVQYDYTRCAPGKTALLYPSDVFHKLWPENFFHQPVVLIMLTQGVFNMSLEKV